MIFSERNSKVLLVPVLLIGGKLKGNVGIIRQKRFLEQNILYKFLKYILYPVFPLLWTSVIISSHGSVINASAEMV